MVGYSFCPRGYVEADGTQLSINANTALYSLYGTIYGGDGRTTFALPDLRGRVNVNAGTGAGLPTYSVGQKFGAETITFSEANLPPHNHLINAILVDGDKRGAGNDFLARMNLKGLDMYHDGPADTSMDPGSMSHTGGSASIAYRAPYLTMRWCIATTGVYPSRN